MSRLEQGAEERRQAAVRGRFRPSDMSRDEFVSDLFRNQPHKAKPERVEDAVKSLNDVVTELKRLCSDIERPHPQLTRGRSCTCEDSSMEDS